MPKIHCLIFIIKNFLYIAFDDLFSVRFAPLSHLLWPLSVCPFPASHFTFFFLNFFLVLFFFYRQLFIIIFIDKYCLFNDSFRCALQPERRRSQRRFRRIRIWIRNGIQFGLDWRGSFTYIVYVILHNQINYKSKNKIKSIVNDKS